MSNLPEIPKLSIGQVQTAPEQLLEREKLGEAAFKRMIREMGLKVTGQRVAILECMTSGRAHVTAQEVFEEVNAKYPDIGFATVYRFLRKMTEQGFATEVRLGGLPARYELTPQKHHDHLTCVSCGRIIEFENHEIERLQNAVAVEHGFQLTSHVLELYGVCQGLIKTGVCSYQQKKTSK